MATEKILLQFEADIKDLKSELGQVKGKLSDTEKEGKKTGSSLTRSFSNVGKAIAAAFSVNLIIQFTKRAVELYDIQAKAETQLLQALKGREDVQKRLIKQAQDLQKVTLFGDEATIQAQSMLAKFGMTETQIRRLIPLIQDYATVSGQDLVSAADMVARSVGTSTNALTRYGIEIEGAVGSNERLESAVNNLSKMVGGQAVAAAEAGAGAVQQFGNSWGDFAEVVGEWALPAITKVVEGIGNLIENLQYAQKTVHEIRQGVRDSQEQETFISEQELFIQYLNNTKGAYDDLKGSADKYLSVVDGLLKDYNERIANGEQLSKVEENTYKNYVIQTEAVREYVKETENATIKVDSLTTSNKKLGDTFKVNKKDLEEFVYELHALNDVITMGIQGGFIDVEQTAKALLSDTFPALKDSTVDFEEQLRLLGFETLPETRDQFEGWFQGLNAGADAFGGLAFAMRELGKENERALGFAQQAALAQVIFAQGASIANALKIASTSSPDPITFFVALSSILGTIFATIGQATSILNGAKVPQYAEGVVDLKGAGTETSDSIHARLSRGESVITAKGTRQDKGLFEAANKMQLERYINENYVLPALVKVKSEERQMFDDYRLYLALKDGQKQDRDLNKKLIQVLSRRDNRYNSWA